MPREREKDRDGVEGGGRLMRSGSINDRSVLNVGVDRYGKRLVASIMQINGR